VMAGAHPDELELLAYVEEELDRARAGTIRDHTATCAACARQVRELETARDALRAAPDLRLPAERRERLVAELPAPARTPRATPRRLLALVAALIAVAALLAVVAARENGRTVGGQAERAAEQAPPQTSEAERGEAGRSEDAGAPEAAAGKALLAEVEAPPSRVADFLRERGYEARVVDGSVEVQTKRPAAVQRLLNRRFARGDVSVYVR
jgi:anti-sigma factor RsiW